MSNLLPSTITSRVERDGIEYIPQSLRARRAFELRRGTDVSNGASSVQSAQVFTSVQDLQDALGLERRDLAAPPILVAVAPWLGRAEGEAPYPSVAVSHAQDALLLTGNRFGPSFGSRESLKAAQRSSREAHWCVRPLFALNVLLLGVFNGVVALSAALLCGDCCCACCQASTGACMRCCGGAWRGCLKVLSWLCCCCCWE